MTVTMITRNSSGDEIANVNFRNSDIVHTLQNTIDSCMNSATRLRVAWNIQGHRFWYQSKAHIRLSISDSY